MPPLARNRMASPVLRHLLHAPPLTDSYSYTTTELGTGRSRQQQHDHEFIHIHFFPFVQRLPIAMLPEDLFTKSTHSLEKYFSPQQMFSFMSRFFNTQEAIVDFMYCIYLST